jgi:hypothetical protein
MTNAETEKPRKGDRVSGRMMAHGVVYRMHPEKRGLGSEVYSVDTRGGRLQAVEWMVSPTGDFSDDGILVTYVGQVSRTLLPEVFHYESISDVDVVTIVEAVAKDGAETGQRYIIFSHEPCFTETDIELTRKV